jgi:hypothetical protein
MHLHPCIIVCVCAALFDFVLFCFAVNFVFFVFLEATGGGRHDVVESCGRLFKKGRTRS